MAVLRAAFGRSGYTIFSSLGCRRERNIKAAIMNVFLPGVVSELNTISAGSLVLFNMPDRLHAGLIVDDGSTGKAILDFEGEDQHGRNRFMIYLGHHFGNEPILDLQRSRIMPDLSADSLGYGQDADGHAAKALYLSQGGFIVNAGREHYNYKINLQSGALINADIAFMLHAKRWRIEVEDGAGNFETLRDIGHGG